MEVKAGQQARRGVSERAHTKTRRVRKWGNRNFYHNRAPGQARDRAIADWPEGRGSGHERIKEKEDTETKESVESGIEISRRGAEGDWKSKRANLRPEGDMRESERVNARKHEG